MGANTTQIWMESYGCDFDGYDARIAEFMAEHGRPALFDEVLVADAAPRPRLQAVELRPTFGAVRPAH